MQVFYPHVNRLQLVKDERGAPVFLPTPSTTIEDPLHYYHMGIPRAPWKNVEAVVVKKTLKSHAVRIIDVLINQATSSGLKVRAERTSYDPTNPFKVELHEYETLKVIE